MLRQASAEVGAVVAAVVAIAPGGAGSRRQLEAEAPAAAATLLSLLGIPS